MKWCDTLFHDLKKKVNCVVCLLVSVLCDAHSISGVCVCSGVAVSCFVVFWEE